LPNVTIVTPVRDAESYLKVYRTLLRQLDWDPDALRVILVEGDSIDNTVDCLRGWADITLLRCHMGTPKHGSIVNAERFRTLATVFNTGLDAVDLDWSDYVLVLPVDIVWPPDLLRKLVAHAKPIIAPFVWDFWIGNWFFYDVWAFQREGKKFTKFRQDDAPKMPSPMRMDSVGGVNLISADVLRAGCRYTDDEVDIGLCRMAREQGFGIWADPKTEVYHPG